MSQCRSGSKSSFRVYSNAFQEPLPAPRWGSSKTAVCLSLIIRIHILCFRRLEVVCDPPKSNLHSILAKSWTSNILSASCEVADKAADLTSFHFEALAGWIQKSMRLLDIEIHEIMQRGKAREDARASSGTESRFRPQVIVTGATVRHLS